MGLNDTIDAAPPIPEPATCVVRIEQPKEHAASNILAVIISETHERSGVQ